MIENKLAISNEAVVPLNKEGKPVMFQFRKKFKSGMKYE